MATIFNLFLRDLNTISHPTTLKIRKKIHISKSISNFLCFNCNYFAILHPLQFLQLPDLSLYPLIRKPYSGCAIPLFTSTFFKIITLSIWIFHLFFVSLYWLPLSYTSYFFYMCAPSKIRKISLISKFFT